MRGGTMSSKEKDMLREITIEALRTKIESKYKKWFNEMLTAAKNGEFGIRWHNTEEDFPQELAEYLMLDLGFSLYYFNRNNVFMGIVKNLQPGWRNNTEPDYVEVSWQ